MGTERRDAHAFLIGGEQRSSPNVLEVRYPFDRSVVGNVFLATKDDVLEAIRCADVAFAATRKLSGFEKAKILRETSTLLELNRETFVKTLVLESGKARKDADAEVSRAVTTFAVAAEEAQRIGGEVLPVDITAATKGRKAITQRFPLGPVAAITPFNFPLNLVAHKLAPAIAAGCPVVLKPASKTPLCALLLGEIILRAGWPGKALSIVPCRSADAEPLITDERIRLLTFTGSPLVGWDLKNRAGKKKVVLELGGNAAVIVHEDADLKLAAQRLKIGGFYYSGQNCIHSQRILVHKKIEKEFTKEFLAQVKSLKLGDPLDKTVDMSAMISAKDTGRITQWVDEARKKGAKVLCGGKTADGIFQPTVLANVPHSCLVVKEEVFAPVVILETYTTFDEALQKVNDTKYGLQAGVFTNNINLVMKAFSELEVGGVIINDMSSFRVDNMPYGGIKDSGFGREGIKYSIQDMTDLKVLVMNLS